MGSYAEKVSDKVNDFDSYRVFFTNDSLDIASYETARRTLNKMVNEKKIRHVIDGFYYNPRYSELIGEYEVISVHGLALTVARKHNWSVTPYNSTALNLLGLSTQVPTHYRYISSRRYKEYKIGDTILELKKVNPREIANMSLKIATVTQTIKPLGKENITDEVIQKVRGDLSEEEGKDLMNESKSASSWIYEVIREVSESKNE